ncbi:MAG: adenosine kinase [Candidatus Kapabacteria bacterium]|nr:adenosine kinase [Candidatus Kapabacteria bacterium]
MSKKLEICGIGNGLIDLQYEVTDKDLEKLNLKKSQMKIVSEAEQKQLLEYLKDKTCHISSGGSAANTLIAFSKFGGVAGYKTVLGKDEFGDFYSKEFKEIGIELSANFIDEYPTGTCVVLITPDSERTMNTCLGATGQFNANHIDENLIIRSNWLYTEGYKLSSEKSAEAVIKSIEIAKKNYVKVAVTFSDVFITENFRSVLELIVKKSDFIFCNEQEAISFTQTSNIDEAVQELKRFVPNFAVTLGSKGSLIYWNNNIIKIPAIEVKAIDTTGAGDMFAAGILYGIVKGLDIEKAGKLAAYSAGKVVSQFGARLNEDHIEIKNMIINS